MHVFASLPAGLIFGLGLIVSGLANPAQVLVFVAAMLAGVGIRALLEPRTRCAK